MKLNSLLTLSLTACLAHAQNLSSLLANTTQLSSLAAILQPYPELVSTLEAARNVTLFAPNNAAFAAANASGALAAVSAMSNGVPSLIQYHVLNQTVFASAIHSTPLFPHTLLNSTAYSNVTGGQVVDAQMRGNNVTITSGLKSMASVVTPNINFTGGVIHIIDSVLTIPTNISNTAGAGGLSAFSGALQNASLVGPVDGLRDITVFAPSNAAFEAIGSALGTLSTSQLSSILEYHVINGTIGYSSALSNMTVPTLAGRSLNITVLPNGAVYVNQALVINADNLVANGVVHIIDGVLNPNGTAATPNTTSRTVAFPGATSASLGGLTSGPAPTTTAAGLTSTNSAVASGYTGSRSTAGSGPSTSPSSTGGAVPMATAALAGAIAVGGWAALVAAA